MSFACSSLNSAKLLDGRRLPCSSRRHVKRASSAITARPRATPRPCHLAREGRYKSVTSICASSAPGDVEQAGAAGETEQRPRPLPNSAARVGFRLNVLWQQQFCAVAVDQVLLTEDGKPRQRTPVTEYYFWPKVDAWEELKKTLDSKDWISETESIILMNKFTDIINYWQQLHSKEEAQAEFEDVYFSA